MKKSIILFSCFALAALIFTSMTYIEFNNNKSNLTVTENQIGGYKIGDTATDFKLKNIDGKMVSMADYPDAKGYIVIFTCNHCPYAKMYEDRIIELDKKYSSNGYPVIAINPSNIT